MRRSRRIAKLPATPAGVNPRDLEFLYHHEGQSRTNANDRYRGFFLSSGSNVVPPKYPDVNPPGPTKMDDVLGVLSRKGYEAVIPALQFLNKEWCHAVRKFRFTSLVIDARVDEARLLDVFRPETVLPYVRHLGVKSVDDLDRMLPFLEQVSHYAPIEYLELEYIRWDLLTVDARACIIEGFPRVRALDVYNVNFTNSNQLLRVLNAYPLLQYLRIGCSGFTTYNHVPAQIYRSEPLLLTELVFTGSYTGLYIDWLLGQRAVTAVEEIFVSVQDVYRDDPKLARFLKKISPWLKVFRYMEHCDHMDVVEGLVNYRAERIGIEFGDDMMNEDDRGFPIENDVMEVDVQDPEIHERWPNKFESDDEGDEDENCRENDLSNAFPSWTCAEDRGYAEFADELRTGISTPMLEKTVARIYWKLDISLLTLKMLCSMSFPSKTFVTFDVTLYFKSEDVYERAPWSEVDLLLSSLALPVENRCRGSFVLRVGTQGWDIDTASGHALRLSNLVSKLPKTMEANVLGLKLDRWTNINSYYGLEWDMDRCNGIERRWRVIS